MNEEIIQEIARKLKVSLEQVKNTLGLLEEGNTVPFIARYRKEVTGSLNDEVLRALYERLNYLRKLDEQKEKMIYLQTY